MKISEQAVQASKNGIISPLQQRLHKHAAHVMAGMLHADDRLVLVITREQADQLAKE